MKAYLASQRRDSFMCLAIYLSSIGEFIPDTYNVVCSLLVSYTEVLFFRSNLVSQVSIILCLSDYFVLLIVLSVTLLKICHQFYSFLVIQSPLDFLAQS